MSSVNNFNKKIDALIQKGGPIREKDLEKATRAMVRDEKLDPQERKALKQARREIKQSVGFKNGNAKKYINQAIKGKEHQAETILVTRQALADGVFDNRDAKTIAAKGQEQGLTNFEKNRAKRLVDRAIKRGVQNVGNAQANLERLLKRGDGIRIGRRGDEIFATLPPFLPTRQGVNELIRDIRQARKSVGLRPASPPVRRLFQQLRKSVKAKVPEAQRGNRIRRAFERFNNHPKSDMSFEVTGLKSFRDGPIDKNAPGIFVEGFGRDDMQALANTIDEQLKQLLGPARSLRPQFRNRIMALAKSGAGSVAARNAELQNILADISRAYDIPNKKDLLVGFRPAVAALNDVTTELPTTSAEAFIEALDGIFSQFDAAGLNTPEKNAIRSAFERPESERVPLLAQMVEAATSKRPGINTSYTISPIANGGQTVSSDRLAFEATEAGLARLADDIDGFLADVGQPGLTAAQRSTLTGLAGAGTDAVQAGINQVLAELSARDVGIDQLSLSLANLEGTDGAPVVSSGSSRPDVSEVGLEASMQQVAQDLDGFLQEQGLAGLTAAERQSIVAVASLDGARVQASLQEAVNAIAEARGEDGFDVDVSVANVRTAPEVAPPDGARETIRSLFRIHERALQSRLNPAGDETGEELHVLQFGNRDREEVEALLRPFVDDGEALIKDEERDPGTTTILVEKDVVLRAARAGVIDMPNSGDTWAMGDGKSVVAAGSLEEYLNLPMGTMATTRERVPGFEHYFTQDQLTGRAPGAEGVPGYRPDDYLGDDPEVRNRVDGVAHWAPFIQLENGERIQNPGFAGIQSYLQLDGQGGMEMSLDSEGSDPEGWALTGVTRGTQVVDVDVDFSVSRPGQGAATGTVEARFVDQQTGSVRVRAHGEVVTQEGRVALAVDEATTGPGQVRIGDLARVAVAVDNFYDVTYNDSSDPSQPELRLSPIGIDLDGDGQVRHSGSKSFDMDPDFINWDARTPWIGRSGWGRQGPTPTPAIENATQVRYRENGQWKTVNLGSEGVEAFIEENVGLGARDDRREGAKFIRSLKQEFQLLNAEGQMIGAFEDRPGATGPSFYYNANGQPARDNQRAETTTWLESAGDGHLVWDFDGNGDIESVKELFGEYDENGNKVYANGWERLKQFDTNNDGLVNQAELARAASRGVQVWVDADQDADVDAGELKSLEELGIRGISVRYNPETLASEVLMRGRGNR